MTDVCIVLHPYTARKDLGAGHDRYAYELIQHLPEKGVKLSLFESGHLTGIFEALLAELRAIFRLRKNRNKGVYHATATANAMAPLSAHCGPLVTTIHDVLWFFVKDSCDSKLKYYLKTLAIKRAARRSDAIIVPFQSTFDFLVKELNVPKSRVHIVNYGVDHSAFYPLGTGEILPEPECFKGIKGKRILFVGAVNYGKGIDTLIRSFDAVKAKVPDAQLIIGSNGWDLPLIKQLWEASHSKDSIHFVGFIPENELRSAYIHADVTCFPSRYGFGLPTLESMACGTPTVSGRTLDAPEFVEDAGLLTDPNNPDELAEKLIAVLNDKDLHQNLRSKGLVKAAKYSWEKTAEETASIYKGLQ